MVTLLAYWSGEFGWELMAWQGHLRWLSNKYNIEVITRKGNEMLYDDFAKKIYTFDFPTEKANMWMNDFNQDEFNKYLNSIKGNSIILHPHNIGYYPSKGLHKTGENFSKQVFRQYISEETVTHYDVLVHARNRALAPQRNWGEASWDVLIKRLLNDGLTVATIGTGQDAYHSPLADNYPDLPLQYTVALMNKTKLVVGESSGAMHLAALAGAPTLVWGASDNRIRYEHFWNPLQFECTFVDGWNQDVQTIYDLIKI